jgi:hypothetical protein
MDNAVEALDSCVLALSSGIVAHRYVKDMLISHDREPY